MKAPPKWAQDLTLNALLWWESQGNKAIVPVLIWRQGTRSQSSGHARPPEEITITAGHNRTDQKLVLLHEIAHILAGSVPKYLDIEQAKKRGWVFSQEPAEPIISRREYHTPRFWEIAWQLYRWAKLPIRYCQKREYSYKVGAQVAYRRNRKVQH